MPRKSHRFLENRRGRTRLAVVALLLLALLCLLIFLIGPECLILKYTDFYCTGCGTRRMLCAMLDGELGLAFRLNPFMFLSLPLGIAYVLLEAWRFVMGRRPLYRGRWVVPAAVALLLLAGVFTVARNLPSSPIAPV